MSRPKVNKAMMINAAIPMTIEQVKDLADRIQHDPNLWNQFVGLELDTEKRLADAAAQGRWIDDPDVVLDPPKLPSMDMLVFDFLNLCYGPDHGLDRAMLIMEMRRRVRVRLGLAV
ncbi:hypothetical protein ONR75_07360 [Rhodopseudomonas sp. P2A-2r]|uniref:hypothetical protein n=1 Tax=Rhodopseudomonas sp. P2A-2r TaxID=2991972 RepID=UPI002233F02E|nr:hypothetical protein [Rhodopseudomonas sp. P2A-2r]UZE50499.1 hypothetical protein ONR75_07360 [Rhodopseudomonas sp. P2A-2r]